MTSTILLSLVFVFVLNVNCVKKNPVQVSTFCVGKFYNLCI